MFSNGFDGTDLASVYGSGNGYDSGIPPPPPAMQSMNVDAPPRQVQQTAPAATSHAMPPEVAYNPPPAMYAQGPAASAPGYMMYGPSYWDRLASKRGEVFKLVAFSLVFLLGLSIHHMAKSYLKSYINDAFLTPIQELLVRLSYPVIVILALWIMKTGI